MITAEDKIGKINISGLNQIKIGRLSEKNDHTLSHPSVSEEHAHLEFRPGIGWWIVDHNSEHGTYVNFQQVPPEGLLVTETDTIWIAPYALRLSADTQDNLPKPVSLKLDIVNLQRIVDDKILLDLKGTPLSFRPGEFVAIVGGSGAGKSTLLKAILGVDTIPPKGRIGDIYFNNMLLIHNEDIQSFSPLSSIIGYVPQQDDSIHFSLSPEEALSYAADLRFAPDVTEDEKWIYINGALKFVRLDREELRKRKISRLSGGQRKRVNIAMELINQPRILFLDEPTSGLDPGLDLELMQLFKAWARGDHDSDPKTIILITHATENVRLCDYIVFMGRRKTKEEEYGGSMLYFGSPDESISQFFGTNHLAEVYLEVDNPENAEIYHQKIKTTDPWNKYLWARGRTAEDIRISEKILEQSVPNNEKQEKFNLDKLKRQFKTLSSRYWKLIRNDSSAFIFQILQGILVALLLWSVAAADTFSLTGIRSAPTTIFILAIAASWLGILNSTKEIVKERRIFGRETRYGIDTASYVLSKFYVLGGLGLWQVGTLLLVTMIRFQPENHFGTFGRVFTGNFQLPYSLEFEWFITLELLLLSGLAIGFLISSLSKSIDQATLLMFPVMLIQILLAGLLFDVGSLSWLSFTNWGMKAMGNSINLQHLFEQAGKASDPILDKINFSGDPLRLVIYWIILILMTFILLSMTIWRQDQKDKARIPDD